MSEANIQDQNIQPKGETRTRKFWRVVFGSMLGFLFSTMIVSILYMIMLISMVASISAMDKDTVTVKGNSILKVDLSVPIQERAVENPLSNFSSQITAIGLDDILASIKQAANDPNIKGIYLNSTTAGASPATLKEIHDVLVQFKQSGKFILSYCDSYTQNGYYLATTADKIILNPAGGIDLRGYAFQIMFYKGLIDKLDLDVQIVRHGQFKSAVEPYILDKMSEANKEQMNLLANTLWSTLADDISKARNISTDSINLIADEMLCATANDALALRLIDKVGYAADAETWLKRKINVGDNEAINFVSLPKYAKTLVNNSKSKDKIAIVYASGSIYDGKGDATQGIYSYSFIKEFRKAYNDKNVKAIVLRVNSPGGSALASENIWREIEAAKKAGKIIVTSMGDYAASGGYYISCNSDYIFAQPNTLTGSIGVFGMIPSFQNFLKNKLGITIDGVKTNKHSDFGTGFRPMDDTELSKMQISIEQVYGTFLKRVSDGRHLSVAAVDSIGQGRVWAGKDALAIGLVDKLGSLDDAISKAASLAKISNYSIVEYPTEKPWYYMFLNHDDEIEAAIQARLGQFYFMYQGVNQVLSQEGIQARMPMDIYIQ